MGAVGKFKIRKQHGISLTGVIFWLVILGSLLVLGLRIVPVVTEYQSIKNAVAHAKATGGSVAQMRTAYDLDARVNDVESLHGKDLEFTRDGDHFEIAFAYERRIPLVANASLLLAFASSTNPSITDPGKTAAADK
jgi:hypothetical protein